MRQRPSSPPGSDGWRSRFGRRVPFMMASLVPIVLTFNLIPSVNHRSRDGQNVGTLTASEEELLGVTGALKQAGKGVIQLISDAYLTNDDEFAARELRLIRSIAQHTGRKLSA
jgi:N-acyl-D-aspartate/D-glutamate deacylase